MRPAYHNVMTSQNSTKKDHFFTSAQNNEDDDDGYSINHNIDPRDRRVNYKSGFKSRANMQKPKPTESSMKRSGKVKRDGFRAAAPEGQEGDFPHYLPIDYEE